MSAKIQRYTEAVGRRKTATARVRISEAKSASMVVNGKTAEQYFPLLGMVKTAFSPLQALGATYSVSAKVQGGRGGPAGCGPPSLAWWGRGGGGTRPSPQWRKDWENRGFPSTASGASA